MAVTLIVEDGTNVANANSYISLVDAVAYFNNRNDQSFNAATPDQQAGALVRAAQGMDYWLNGRWYGRRTNQSQSLDWPRTGVVDSDCYPVASKFIPQKLKFAQCEVAKIELKTPFIQNSVSKDDAVQSESVGPISITYKDTAPSITYWPLIIAMLKDFAVIGVMPIEVVIGITERERAARNEDHNGFGLNPFDFPDYFHLLKEPIYNPGYDAPWTI